jgi:hypothetical protein
LGSSDARAAGGAGADASTGRNAGRNTGRCVRILALEVLWMYLNLNEAV